MSDSRPGVCPMAGRGARGFGSIHPFVVAGVMGYFLVVLHPRLQQDTCPIAADCFPLRHNSLAIDITPSSTPSSARKSRPSTSSPCASDYQVCSLYGDGLNQYPCTVLTWVTSFSGFRVIFAVMAWFVKTTLIRCSGQSEIP